MEDFVSYELAVKLKEKGFPQIPDYFKHSSYYEWDGLRKIHPLYNVNIWFDNTNKKNLYFAPTISQALKWLREEKKIHLVVDIEPKGYFFNVNYNITKNLNGRYKFDFYNSWNCYSDDKQAILAGIEYILDNLI
jgi:hypothetical protein